MYSEDEGQGGQGGQGRRFGRGGRGGGRPFIPKPIKEGDEIDLTIEAMGSRGDGIGKIEGFVVFVPGVQTGETVKVKIKEIRGRSAIGEKLE
jgi:predicted RNA-binding protein with TRAM domain